MNGVTSAGKMPLNQSVFLPISTSHSKRLLNRRRHRRAHVVIQRVPVERLRVNTCQHDHHLIIQRGRGNLPASSASTIALATADCVGP